MPASLRYYILFTLSFSLFWFLFKLGGFIDAGAAFRSTAVDMTLTIAALAGTVEWLLPRYFYKGRYRRFGLGLAGIIFLGGSVNIVVQLALMHTSLGQYQANVAKHKEHFFYWFWSDLVAGSYFMIAMIALTGFAIRLGFDRIRAARRLAELEAENLRSELENLKNQVNPHFLFNALNTIYYRIDRNNAAARTLTQQFAELLRYQLYECNDPAVPMEKEIKFIGNYIELQKERSGDQLVVTMRGFQHWQAGPAERAGQTGQTSQAGQTGQGGQAGLMGRAATGSTPLAGLCIPPHLLMPLVENCFKHVSHFTDRVNWIELSCQLETGNLVFATRNSIDPNKKKGVGEGSGKGVGEGSGIGLSATRKRLALLYKDRYMLAAHQSGGCFETTLKLPVS